jgi:hypothetical protein
MTNPPAVTESASPSPPRNRPRITRTSVHSC